MRLELQRHDAAVDLGAAAAVADIGVHVIREIKHGGAVRQIERGDFSLWCRENPGAGIKVLARVAAVLADRVRKGNDDVLKLSTALSIALAR